MAPRAHSVSLQFRYPTPRSARAVADAVRVECGEIERETGHGDRSTASVDRSGSTVEVRLTAGDLVALRAGINTWNRLVEVAERLVGIAQGDSRTANRYSPTG